MTEKKSKNPFINLANEAKKNNNIHPGLGKAPKQQGPKPSKGFGGQVMRKTGRGG